MFENIDHLKDYINVHISDIRLLQPYVADALERKVYKFIPKSVIDHLETNQPDIYQKLEKAVANYTLVQAIPFIKVNISNIGINNFNDEKLKKSDWWDVRDYALSAARIANDTLAAVIEQLRETNSDQLPFLQNHFYNIFPTPTVFSNQIYNIGKSYEVFEQLIPLMETVWQIKISSRIAECSIEDIKQDSELYSLLKKAIGFYTIADAIGTGYLTFTTTGVVMQYEELPWQKSQLLSERMLDNLSLKLTQRANELMNLLFDFIKENADRYPCYQPDDTYRKPIAKKSGLYF